MLQYASVGFSCRPCPLPEQGPTRRQSQRQGLSRVVLAHAPRQPPSWLIFDVRHKTVSLVNPVWIFHASGARFAGGAFEDTASAEAWIRNHKLSGVLTAYPRGEGCFDWALRSGLTGMKLEKLKEKGADPAFVGGFTSAAQDHIHFENGERA